MLIITQYGTGFAIRSQHNGNIIRPARFFKMFCKNAMPSTIIRSFDYDNDAKTLRVVLVNGTVYDYFGVPYEVYEQMKAAFSKGTFYNRHIKPNYTYKKVSDL